MATNDPRQERIAGRGGAQLQTYHWPHDGEPRGRLLIVHGFAEHGRRYDHVAALLTGMGLDTWAVDLRGHGLSDGRRGHILSFSEYLDDVDVALEQVLGHAPEGPLFLLGHSMGGLIAARYAEHGAHAAELAGLVLSSPYVQLAMPVPSWQQAMGRLMSSVWPGFAQETGLDPSGLSHDPEVVRAYAEDPLVFTRARARWFVEITAAQEAVVADADRITLPVLLWQGSADPVVSPEGTRRLHGAIASADKRLIVFDDLFHEPLNEADSAQVFQALGSWLEAHLPGAA